jgi:flagellar biosynthesis GTPase FlhF
VGVGFCFYKKLIFSLLNNIKITLETMTPNIFSAIAENDDDFKITPREKFLKKAAKKLNEIERLKEKGICNSLTIDECEKLLKEDFWKSCLFEEPLKPNIKEERKRKKEEEKMKKQEEERRVYEEYKKKMEEKERKRKEEQKREEEEYRKRKEEEYRKRKEEERKRKNQETKARKNGKSLEDEYKNVLLLHHGNNDKTFRLLSLKYHPDKNVGRPIWASEMQKQLGGFREKYNSF